jgi:hypothetical protein
MKLSRKQLTALCAEARTTRIPVPVASDGYAVEAERLQTFVPGVRHTRTPWRWMYLLVTPDGSRLGGHDTVASFVEFAARHLRARVVAAV